MLVVCVLCHNLQDQLVLCIAENCKGEEVVSATSLANSVCSSAGVPSPYWRIPSSVSDSLDYAATAIPTSDASSEAIATSSAVAEESSAVEESSTVAEASSEQPQETGSSIVPESSVTDAPETSTTNGDLGFTQYPSVAKTASYNGFADPIYDSVPDCAKDCLKQSTSNTHVLTGTPVVCVLCHNLVVQLVNVLLNNVKVKKLFLPPAWLVPCVLLLVFGNHTG